MKKWMQFVGVPFLVAGIFGMMIGPNVNVSADEPTAASGSGVTIETPAETPLGAAVITAAKKSVFIKTGYDYMDAERRGTGCRHF